MEEKALVATTESLSQTPNSRKDLVCINLLQWDFPVLHQVKTSYSRLFLVKTSYTCYNTLPPAASLLQAYFPHNGKLRKSTLLESHKWRLNKHIDVQPHY